jgi:2-phospho-L-lactate guanylyltransferase
VSGDSAAGGRADAAGWTVVVPVKSLSGAKTRLAPDLSAGERAALARAFALDTIDAARAARLVSRVVVVSDEPLIEAALRETAAVEVVPELGPRGLAAAIGHGITVARASSLPTPRFETSRMADGTGHPGLLEVQGGASEATPGLDTSQMQGRADHPRLFGGPGQAGGADGAVAVLLGDLPAMRAGDLDAALDAAARHPLAFAPDAEGTGTTLATARAGVAFVPHFGADSAARHAAAGFADLVAEHPGAVAPGLRRDVDTAAELREAVALGVGPHTAEVVRTLAGLAGAPAPRHPLDPSTAPAGADRKAAS